MTLRGNSTGHDAGLEQSRGLLSMSNDQPRRGRLDSVMRVAAILLFCLGCAESTIVSGDTPSTDGGARGGTGGLTSGALFDACRPGGGRAFMGFITSGSSSCDRMRTTELPRLEVYLAGDGPRWAVGDDLVILRYCDGETECEEPTAGTVSVGPSGSSPTRLEVDLVFPSTLLSASYAIELCASSEICD